MDNIKKLEDRIKELEESLSYVIGAADNWYDECRGGELDTEGMRKARGLLINDKAIATFMNKLRILFNDE